MAADAHNQARSVDVVKRLATVVNEFSYLYTSHASEGALVQLWIPRDVPGGCPVLSTQGSPFAIMGTSDTLALYKYELGKYSPAADEASTCIISRVFADMQPELPSSPSHKRQQDHQQQAKQSSNHHQQQQQKNPGQFDRVAIARRCRIHSTLLLAMYDALSADQQPAAVFELAQHEDDVDFTTAVSILNKVAQDAGFCVPQLEAACSVDTWEGAVQLEPTSSNADSIDSNDSPPHKPAQVAAVTATAATAADCAPADAAVAGVECKRAAASPVVRRFSCLMAETPQVLEQILETQALPAPSITEQQQQQQQQRQQQQREEEFAQQLQQRLEQHLEQQQQQVRPPRRTRSRRRSFIVTDYLQYFEKLTAVVGADADAQEGSHAGCAAAGAAVAAAGAAAGVAQSTFDPAVKMPSLRQGQDLLTDGVEEKQQHVMQDGLLRASSCGQESDSLQVLSPSDSVMVLLPGSQQRALQQEFQHQYQPPPQQQRQVVFAVLPEQQGQEQAGTGQPIHNLSGSWVCTASSYASGSSSVSSSSLHVSGLSCATSGNGTNGSVSTGDGVYDLFPGSNNGSQQQREQGQEAEVGSIHTMQQQGRADLGFMRRSASQGAHMARLGDMDSKNLLLELTMKLTRAKSEAAQLAAGAAVGLKGLHQAGVMHSTMDRDMAASLKLGAPLCEASCGRLHAATLGKREVTVAVMQHSSRSAKQVAGCLDLLRQVPHPHLARVAHYITHRTTGAAEGGQGDASALRDTSHAVQPAVWEGGSSLHRQLSLSCDRDSRQVSRAVETWLVLGEGLELGSLAGMVAAGNSGALFKEDVPQLDALLTVLLGVARGMECLHARHITHGDLRAANVMLTAAPPCEATTLCQDAIAAVGLMVMENVSDSIDEPVAPAAAGCVPGVKLTAKVFGAGLARVLHENRSSQKAAACYNAAGIGPWPISLTRAAGQLPHEADVFAFGVLMWEAIRGGQPYSIRATVASMAEAVTEEGRQLNFGPLAPKAYRELAQSCWFEDPKGRPTFTQLAAQLRHMTGKLQQMQAQVEDEAQIWKACC